MTLLQSPAADRAVWAEDMCLRPQEGIQLLSRSMPTRAIVALATAALTLSLVMASATSVLAANPDWRVGYGTDSSLPAAQQPTFGASTTSVAAGAKVGYFVWLRNADTSNISQLFVDATTSPAATVVGDEVDDLRLGRQLRARRHLPERDTADVLIRGAERGQHGLCRRRVHDQFDAHGRQHSGGRFPVQHDGDATGQQQQPRRREAPPCPGADQQDGDGVRRLQLRSAEPHRRGRPEDHRSDSRRPRSPSTRAWLARRSVTARRFRRSAILCCCQAPVPSFFSCSLLDLADIRRRGRQRQDLQQQERPRDARDQGDRLLRQDARPVTGPTRRVPLLDDATGVRSRRAARARCTFNGAFPNFPVSTTPCLVVGTKQVTVWRPAQTGLSASSRSASRDSSFARVRPARTMSPFRS